MILALRALFFVMGFALLGAAWAQPMYRWVDKEGRVHYSQQPPPADAANSLEQKKLGAAVPTEGQVPYALQQATRNYPVVLYTSPNCKQGCREARELLSKRGIPFKEVSVSDQSTSELLKKATGGDKVPSLTVGTLSQIGYQPNTMNSLLDTAGYPRTPLIATRHGTEQR